MRYISLFAGIGGFDLALDRLGHECVFANDNDKYCKLTYDKNFAPRTTSVSQIGTGQSNASTEQIQDGEGLHTLPSEGSIPTHRRHLQYVDRSIDQRQLVGSRRHNHELNTQDIRQLSTDDIPDHDILVGGFPCQSFSIAGNRGGFSDTRGTLFFEIARIVAAKRPTYLFLENVKGLLSHDNGRTFETILRTLDELGYDLQWQVCNSKNFGVPQNRERVYIVGHTRGQSRPKIFPLSETSPTTLEYVGGILSERASKWLNDGKSFSRNFPQGSRVYSTEGIASTLASQAGGLGAKTGLYAVTINHGKVREQANKISTTLPATYHKGLDNHGARTGVLHRISSSQDGKINDVEGVSQTLSAGHYNQPKIAHTIRVGGQGSPHGSKQNWDSYEFEGRIRRLTPKECERLQGFPDDWTLGVSDTQRYKQLGNAVTTNVVYAIASKFPKAGGSNEYSTSSL